jgi:DNA-binding MarR family transcriptional regulator
MEYIDQNALGCSNLSADFDDQIEKVDGLGEPRSIPLNAISTEILERLDDIKARIVRIENACTLKPDEEVNYSDDIKFYKWLKAEYENRLFRQSSFEQDYITGEPCWDVLLDLCIAEIEGHRVSVTSLCIASGVPSTTALRWISLLERDDLIERQADPRDKRRTFLRITKRAFETMLEYHRRITKNR